MKDLKSLDIHDITKAISKILHRFHLVIFVVVVLGGMTVVIFLINETITRANSLNNDNMTPTSSTFDMDTINKLKELEEAGNQGQIDWPNGRINPFSE
jgi:hypothetical protein